MPSGVRKSPKRRASRPKGSDRKGPDDDDDELSRVGSQADNFLNLLLAEIRPIRTLLTTSRLDRKELQQQITTLELCIAKLEGHEPSSTPRPRPRSYDSWRATNSDMPVHASRARSNSLSYAGVSEVRLHDCVIIVNRLPDDASDTHVKDFLSTHAASQKFRVPLPNTLAKQSLIMHRSKKAVQIE